MPTPFEYMQFATGVYAASDLNKIAPPAGWSLLDWQPDKFTGFSAGVYKNDLTNEIVISYAGTNDKIADPLNWTAGIGAPAPQIYDAMAYYFAFRAAYPTANITFAGHSLGGGLASLMAVLFDKQATVFDAAPFQLAAMQPALFPSFAAAMATSGYLDGALATFIASGGLLALTRESNVTQYYVQGEVLSTIRFSGNTLVGSDNPILMGNSTAAMVDRHSMALMTALWNSPSFLLAAQRLPDLVTEMLDQNLFATDSRNPNKDDLLRKLLRHQLGVSGAVQPDGMLTRFAADSLKIAQDGGLTLTNANITKTLTAFAMQMYYANPAAADASKQLFSDVTGGGGIRFNREDVAASLNDAKGYGRYFLTYLQENFTAAELDSILSELPAINDWYIQAGNVSMSASGGDERAFMLGGTGSDNLSGGNSADLLVGGAGDDTLNGGDGNDNLIGGDGADQLYGGDGSDFIQGGYGNDGLYGGNETDYLSGDKGDDILYGGDDDATDYLLGGDDNDTLVGGGGDDVLDGQSGSDRMAGGEGYDYYFATAGDVINDSDGEGTIYWGNDYQLVGGACTDGSSVYSSADEQLAYSFAGTSLVIAAKAADSHGVPSGALTAANNEMWLEAA